MRKFLNGSFFAMMIAIAACEGTSSSPTGLALTPRASGGSGGGGGGGGGGSGSGGSTTLNFLTAANGTSITSPVAFYAVQGQDRTVEVSYVSANGGNTSRRFIRLRIRARTQIVRPDGSLLAAGDSILITITTINPSQMVAQFEPSGLLFTGKDPATLTMSYSGADHDFNHDGVIDSLDAAIERSLSLFRQEGSTLPWFRVTGALDLGLDEITASIPGFTNYVIAY